MPSTVLGLVLFVCFITPGLIFELLRERSRPARQYSVLRETSVIIVASVCLIVPATALLIWLRNYVGRRNPELERKWFPHFYSLAEKPAQYSASHLTQVVFFTLAAIMLAGLLAVIADGVLRKLEPPGGSLRNNPMLFDVLNGPYRPEDAKAVIAAVELKNGSVIHGAILGHESKTDQTLAWIAVKRHSQIPYAIRKPNGDIVPIPIQWPYLLIPGDQVLAINASFSATAD